MAASAGTFFKDTGKRAIMRIAQEEHKQLEAARKHIVALQAEIYCMNPAHEYFRDADEATLKFLKSERERRTALAEKKAA
jgi:hypothetical protein